MPISPTNRLLFYRCQSHLQTDYFSIDANLTYKRYFSIGANLTYKWATFLLVLTTNKPDCFYTGANLISNTIQEIMSDQHSENSPLNFDITKISLGE